MNKREARPVGGERLDLYPALHVDLGGQGLDLDPIALEAPEWTLAGHPEYLEQVWDTWEAELILAEWPPERRDQARYWLDAVVIGGLIFP